MSCPAEDYLAGQNSLEGKNIFKNLLDLLFKILEYAILAEVLLSWIMRGRENQFTQIIHTVTEPFMAPGRKLQEKLIPGMMIDFSPILAILFLSILRSVIFTIIG